MSIADDMRDLTNTALIKKYEKVLENISKTAINGKRYFKISHEEFSNLQERWDFLEFMEESGFEVKDHTLPRCRYISIRW